MARPPTDRSVAMDFPFRQLRRASRVQWGYVPSHLRDIRRNLGRTLDRIWEQTHDPKREYTIFIGKIPEANQTTIGQSIAVVPAGALWQLASLQRKLRCVLTGDWQPTDREKSRAGEILLLDDLFGGHDDFGPVLLNVHAWLNRNPPPITLNEGDVLRAA